MRERESGFSLVEVVIAGAIGVFVLLVALQVTQMIIRSAISMNTRVDAQGSVERLVERMTSEAATAWAIFVPATDVLGQSNGDGHEIDFYSQDGSHRSYAWAYVYDKTTKAITRYTYWPGVSAIAGDSVGPVDGFAASPSQPASNLIANGSTIYDPLFANSAIADVRYTFAAANALDNSQDAPLGGNRVVRVHVSGSGVDRTELLTTGTAPTTFTIVVDYTPAPVPIPSPTPTPLPAAVATPTAAPTSTSPSTSAPPNPPQYTLQVTAPSPNPIVAGGPPSSFQATANLTPGTGTNPSGPQSIPVSAVVQASSAGICSVSGAAPTFTVSGTGTGTCSITVSGDASGVSGATLVNSPQIVAITVGPPDPFPCRYVGGTCVLPAESVSGSAECIDPFQGGGIETTSDYLFSTTQSGLVGQPLPGTLVGDPTTGESFTRTQAGVTVYELLKTKTRTVAFGSFRGKPTCRIVTSTKTSVIATIPG